MGVWYLEGWRGYAEEDFDAVTRHYRERGSRSNITGTVAVFGEETQLPRETQEHMAEERSVNGESASTGSRSSTTVSQAWPSSHRWPFGPPRSRRLTSSKRPSTGRANRPTVRIPRGVSRRHSTLAAHQLLPPGRYPVVARRTPSETHVAVTSSATMVPRANTSSSIPTVITRTENNRSPPEPSAEQRQRGVDSAGRSGPVMTGTGCARISSVLSGHRL